MYKYFYCIIRSKSYRLQADCQEFCMKLDWFSHALLSPSSPFELSNLLVYMQRDSCGLVWWSNVMRSFEKANVSVASLIDYFTPSHSIISTDISFSCSSTVVFSNQGRRKWNEKMKLVWMYSSIKDSGFKLFLICNDFSLNVSLFIKHFRSLDLSLCCTVTVYMDSAIPILQNQNLALLVWWLEC